VDSHYYPTRSLDNFVPTLLADDHFVMPSYDIGLYYSGGNFQSSADRQGFVTTLIDQDNPGFGEGYIGQLYDAYQGIDTLHVFPRLPPAVEISLFRIAQEAVNNAVRHAHASHVTLELRKEEGEVILEIADDGGGFREGAVATIPGSALGMVTMRERAEALGGSLEVKSSAQGTVIRVRFPAIDDLSSRG